MAGARDRLRELLLAHSVVTGRAFTLSSGKTSDFYVDCRKTTLLSEGMACVGTILCDWLERESLAPEAIGGMTLGADPVVCAVALESHRRGRPLRGFLVRKAAKRHGAQNRIEGLLEGITTCVIVEDVWTTGGSTLEAVQVAEGAGLRVLACAALVDREEGGAEALTAYPTFSIFRRRDLA